MRNRTHFMGQYQGRASRVHKTRDAFFINYYFFFFIIVILCKKKVCVTFEKINVACVAGCAMQCSFPLYKFNQSLTKFLIVTLVYSISLESVCQLIPLKSLTCDAPGIIETGVCGFRVVRMPIRCHGSTVPCVINTLVTSGCNEP